MSPVVRSPVIGSPVMGASPAPRGGRWTPLRKSLLCMVGGATLWSAATLAAELGPTAGTQRIPETAGTTLSGGSVRLPEDARGRDLVLVFGFGRGAKEQSTLWGKKLVAWQQQGLSFSFYQVAMLAGAPRFTRPFIVHAMRSSVPDNFKPHMLILSSNEDSWRALIHPKGQADVYVVFCDGGGHVKWETEGAGADQFEQLKDRLDSASSESRQ